MSLDLTDTEAADAASDVHPPPDAVEVRGVSMVYQRRGSDVLAVEGCTFSASPGQRISIIGPSGCGKSTVLRMLADIIRPTSGEVRVGGLSPHHARKARAFALVSQQSVMLPWRRLAENVGLGLEVTRAERGQRRAAVQDAIDLVGLTGFERHYPAELSGGMRQRGAIARALTLSPDVLLMDEPFGALDEFTRQRLNFELLRILDDSRATLVLITHSIAEAIMLSDTVFVMSGRPGRIVARLDVELSARAPDTRDDPAFHRYEHQLRLALADA